MACLLQRCLARWRAVLMAPCSSSSSSNVLPHHHHRHHHHSAIVFSFFVRCVTCCSAADVDVVVTQSLLFQGWSLRAVSTTISRRLLQPTVTQTVSLQRMVPATSFDQSKHGFRLINWYNPQSVENLLCRPPRDIDQWLLQYQILKECWPLLQNDWKECWSNHNRLKGLGFVLV